MSILFPCYKLTKTITQPIKIYHNESDNYRLHCLPERNESRYFDSLHITGAACFGIRVILVLSKSSKSQTL